MPSAALQTSLVREVSVYPGVDLNLQFEIDLVQQLFLVSEVGEKRPRGNARALGDIRRRRTQSDLGDLVNRRLKDCSAFLRTSYSCHAQE